MTLSRRASWFLLGVAAWTAFVWITLVRNIAKDHLPTHGTAFHLVHYVLAAIALVLDVGVTWIGVRGLRSSRPAAAGAGDPGTGPDPAPGAGQQDPAPREVGPGGLRSGGRSARV